jgi:hypothetical protein
MLDKVALEQVLLPALPFSLVRIIPLILHAPLQLSTAPIRRTDGRTAQSWEPSNKAIIYLRRGQWAEHYVYFPILRTVKKPMPNLKAIIPYLVKIFFPAFGGLKSSLLCS